MFHALIKDVAEAVMQMLYQHTNFEEEVYSNTDQLMDIEYDTRFVQGLISLYYTHEAAFKLLSNCFRGSVHQDSTEQIIAYLVKRSTKIISATVKNDDTVFNAYILHWLSRIQVEASLHILSYHYPREQALYQIRIIVAFLRDGFEDLY